MLNYTQESSQILIATKELVDWLLSMNTHNRSIKRTHIELLKKNIIEDNWFFTNQGIGVSKKGILTDGQHRLIAIKECGYPPLKLLIVLGLDEKAQSVVDTHAKRSQSDVIRLLMNRTVSNQAVATINFYMQITSDGTKFWRRGGKTDTFEVADILLNECDLLNALFTSCGCTIRASVMAALMYYAKRYSLDHACKLGEQIKDGVNLEKNDPAYRLRSWLSQNPSGGAPTLVHAYAVTVSACIAHAKGESLQVLRPASSWSRLPKAPKLY